MAEARSYTWNAADGPPPTFAARSDLDEFLARSRGADDRAIFGFYVGPLAEKNDDGGNNDNNNASSASALEQHNSSRLIQSESGELVTRGYSIVERTIARKKTAAEIVAERTALIEARRRQQQRIVPGGAPTLFTRDDDDDAAAEDGEQKKQQQQEQQGEKEQVPPAAAAPAETAEAQEQQHDVHERGEKGASSPSAAGGVDPKAAAMMPTMPIKVRALQVDTDVWDRTWGHLFEKEEIVAAIPDIIDCAAARELDSGRRNNNHNQTPSHRAVMIRVSNRARSSTGAGDRDASSSPSASPIAELYGRSIENPTLRLQVSRQARSCGPLEFVRFNEQRGEIFVQFTAEAAARLFHISTANPEQGGIAAALQRDYGYGTVTSRLMPAQQRGPVPGAAANAGGANANANAQQQPTPQQQLTIVAAAHKVGNEEVGSGAYFDKTGILLAKDYVAALFDALGGGAVQADPLFTADALRAGTVHMAGDEVAPRMVERFRVSFENPEDRLMALHVVQYPLRQLFGLGVMS